MVKETLFQAFSAREYLSLAPVFMLYCINWYTVLHIGVKLNKAQILKRHFVFGSVILGTMCIFTKPFIPASLYQFIVNPFILWFYYSVARINWIKSTITTILLNLVTGTGSMILVFFTLLCYPKLGNILMSTVTGVSVGVITELLPLLIFNALNTSNHISRLIFNLSEVLETSNKKVFEWSKLLLKRCKHLLIGLRNH